MFSFKSLKMKNILLVFMLCIAPFAIAQEDEDYDPSLNWLTDLNEAKIQSEDTKKPILVYFTGSDWCAPCKMLKKDFFNSDAFIEKSDNFILLMVDMPRRTDIISAEQKKKNQDVVRKFNPSGGYPNLVALNDDLNKIGELSGYTFLRETDRHFAFIESVLENY